MTKILSADCVHQNILQYYSCNKVHARHDHESFGVSDAGFPSLYRVSTVPQRLQRSTSQGIVPHYTSAAHAEGHTTHGNSARCSSPRCTYVIRYDRDPGFPPISLSLVAIGHPSYVPKTFTRKPATTFLFPCFFFTCNTGSGESGLSGGSLAYLVIFSVCFFTFAQPFRGACSGRWEECPVAAAEITCVINGVIDHRSSRGRRSESRPFHKTHKRRHAAHRPSSTSTIAAGWQLLAPSFLFVLRIRSRSDV